MSLSACVSELSSKKQVDVNVCKTSCRMTGVVYLSNPLKSTNQREREQMSKQQRDIERGLTSLSNESSHYIQHMFVNKTVYFHIQTHTHSHEGWMGPVRRCETQATNAKPTLISCFHKLFIRTYLNDRRNSLDKKIDRQTAHRNNAAVEIYFSPHFPQLK